MLGTITSGVIYVPGTVLRALLILSPNHPRKWSNNVYLECRSGIREVDSHVLRASPRLGYENWECILSLPGLRLAILMV